MCTPGVFVECTLIRSIGREPNVQIVAAASLNMTKLGHRSFPF
jgi:hypothetical protein